MRTVDFTDRLSLRYTSISKVELDDVRDLVTPLTDGQRSRLWKKFIESYSYNTPPKPAVFVKLLGDTPRGESKEIVAVCETCKISMPVDLRSCVQCGGELICGYKGNNFIYVHQACPDCVKFVLNETIGAHCRYWGVGLDGARLRGDAFEAQKDLCKSCPCKVCCREERIFRSDFELYKQLSVRGDFKGGFERRVKREGKS